MTGNACCHLASAFLVLGVLSKSAFTSKERHKQTKFLIPGILALNPGCSEVVLPLLTSRCQKKPINKNKKQSQKRFKITDLKITNFSVFSFLS